MDLCDDSGLLAFGELEDTTKVKGNVDERTKGVLSLLVDILVVVHVEVDTNSSSTAACS